jgi:hypothetical protein
MSITHPAGSGTVADYLTQRIRAHTSGWAEEVDEATWRAQDHTDDCSGERWVIVATYQLAARDPYGGRPGPLVVGHGYGVEIRIQLPFVVGQDDIDNVMVTLLRFGVLPAEHAEPRTAAGHPTTPGDSQ